MGLESLLASLFDGSGDDLEVLVGSSRWFFCSCCASNYLSSDDYPCTSDCSSTAYDYSGS